MIDLGLLKQFLGLEIVQYEAAIKVSQQKYDSYLLFKFNMDKCKAENSPFLSSIKLGEVGESPWVDNSLYRQLVGCLLYITHYQNDLEYVVGYFYIYRQKNHEIHWTASKSILHYVQGTKHFGVHYVVDSPLELVGFFLF